MTVRLHAVTGAFGYSGKYIAQRLLGAGVEVMTLTNSPGRANPFGGRVRAVPLCFDDPEQLAASLRGVEVLYNTYWVRFNYGRTRRQESTTESAKNTKETRTGTTRFTHGEAVRNTMVLFDAARAAGVRRIVHVSITNPSEESPLEYFAGKARLERALAESGVAHSILRPAVLFGKEDILINNIAWALRRLPVFGVFGDGAYRLQPIHVDDLAALAVQEGMQGFTTEAQRAQRGGEERELPQGTQGTQGTQGEHGDNRVIEAIGPETFSYLELVGTIGEIIGRRRPIVAVPPWLGFAAGWVIGKLVGDVLITREEIEGLMAGLLHVADAPPAGTTRLTDWAREHPDTLGRRYTSELARRRDRTSAYRSN